jgi:hypothetical protein
MRLMRTMEARGADGKINTPAKDVLFGLPSAGRERAQALRQRGNDAFAKCCYISAEEACSDALEAAPATAELLANRASPSSGAVRTPRNTILYICARFIYTSANSF